MQKSSMCHVYAFITILIWSTAYVGTKIVAGTFSSGSIAVMRCLSASVVLLLAAAALRLPAPKKRDLPWFALSALSGISLYLYCFSRGMTSIGPTTSCVLIALTPVITAVLAFLLFGERLSPIGWLAIGAAFCGVLLMALWEGTMNINIGVFWTALAALLFAVYNLMQRTLSRRGYEPRGITAYSFAIGSVFLLPYLFEAVPQVLAAPLWHTVVVALMGVFPSAVAYFLWVKALSLAPKTSYVTNYMFLTPFASLALELAFLRQWPDTGAVLGGILILASLVLFAVAGKKESR